VPDGFDAAMHETPYIFGYSSPSESTVWNYTGDPQDPQSTLDPGEWSLLFHVAEVEMWSMVAAGVSVGGPPQSEAVLGAVTQPCVADINGDGVIGVDDLAAVIEHWGEIGGPADIDGVPGVDVGDLLFVFEVFGETVD
jgi:hypothetical protein